MREALAAAALAFVLLLAMITSPIDQFVWTLQSRLASFEASGEIVFVGAEEDLANPAFPERRRELARALDRLAESDVERVYVDVVFDRPSPADTELRSAMERLGDRLYLVQSYETGPNGEDDLRRSIPELGNGIGQVGKSNYINFLGYVWNAPFTMAQHGNPIASLPVSMMGAAPAMAEYDFPINYGFKLSSIPMLKLGEVALSDTDLDLARDVGGRVVLIGNADKTAHNMIDIPGHIDVPRSLVQIYAAETLKSSRTVHIGGLAILALCAAGVCAALATRLRQWSRRIVAVVGTGLLAAVVIASNLGVRMDVAPSMVFLVLYILLRAKNAWRNQIVLTDPLTNLPTFAALEADTSIARENPVLIVGKIQRLEEVKRTLSEDLHGEYINRIVERLRLKSEDQTFYIDHGHCLAWYFHERDPRLIKDHLEGLRALLSAPLQVGGRLVDVSMTFSFDVSPSQNISKRLAAAVAAVEQTTEAHNPITTTEFASEEDLLWNISLQARIDAALENGEIYVVYQPKILIETGDIVGVEALVRWNDPVRGHIPPDLFIRQCESAGRMLHLTRHVLRQACLAGKDFDIHGRALPVAVNVSATLLHNWEIVGAVRDVLNETAFDPALLTLEVTETYRISSLQTAHEVLADLSTLSLKISMDDFGVGAASFEALLQLPFGELKIDRLFVSKIVDNTKAREIVRHILQLGRELRIIVVAEGVEDPATLAMLKKLGCLVAQGFGIAPPMLAGEILEFQQRRSAIAQKL